MNNTMEDNVNTMAKLEVDVETDFSAALLKFAAVMTFIIMIVGIIGNFLTVAVLIKCPKVRNVAAAFIISLCIADLLFCALVLPFSALRFIDGTWRHGEFLCKLIPFIQYGNIGVSLLCIGMITINRYVMIAHHNSYGRIYKKHWIGIMIAFCWLFSYGMQLPTLFGAWGKFDFDPKLGTCSIMNDSHGHSSKTTLFIIAFIIPCLIIIACYAKIFWVVHESEQRMQRHNNKQNSIPNNMRPMPTPSSDNGQNRISTNLPSDSSTDTKNDVIGVQQKPSRIKDQREMRAKRNEWRITKMVLAIFLSFVICYLPITIAKVADKDVEYPTLHIISYIMLYLSACLNPIIYVIMNKQYRKAYKTVLTCETSKLLPFGRICACCNAVGGVRGIGRVGGAGGAVAKGKGIGANANGNGDDCGIDGSTAAEKWKDTGLSNNHSRTMVSQISTVDQQNSSLSSSQPQTIDVELTTTTTTTPAIIMKSPITQEYPMPTPTMESIKQNQMPKKPMKIEQYHQPQNIQMGQRNQMKLFPPHPLQTAKRDANPLMMIPIVKTVDIIPEEEEEIVIPFAMNQPNSEMANGAGFGTELMPTESDIEKLYMNVNRQKKIPYYGQNINAIPDNNATKLQTNKIEF